nr:MAG TPA: hypothetical protein [Crassvirales sp.]
MLFYIISLVVNYILVIFALLNNSINQVIK